MCVLVCAHVCVCVPVFVCVCVYTVDAIAIIKR